MNQYEYNEKQYVEDPFLKQLKRLGWRVIRATREDAPIVTHREEFRQVVLEDEFREAVKSLNDWLEEDQIREILRRITSFSPGITMLQANREFLDRLLEKVSVSENHRTHQLNPNVKLIDFQNPDKNRYLAISQFKVALPGSMKHIIPDIVLFVNGIPLGVVECKSALIAEPMAEGYKQLQRYMGKRGDIGEGNEKLFYFNQILISTYRDRAKYSTITGGFEHFIEWKDPYPFAQSEIQVDEGDIPRSQEILIQGILSKSNFMDIIYNFIIFQETETGIAKILPRYQQYRATNNILKRLKTGRTKLEKGGIVWHTQGSGKSITMLYVARKLKKSVGGGEWKVVFATNMIELERQADKLFKGVGYTVANPNTIRELKKVLSENNGNLILAMEHKFQERDLERDMFPELNTSDKILIMVDEAHTNVFKLLGANMERAMPKAIKVGFSGTPTERAEMTFGDYIDKYSMTQSVEDEVTVKIVYEGRTHKAAVVHPDELDHKFVDVFADVPDEERNLIVGQYTRQAYLEARKVIIGKACDMVEHYVKHVFPNRFKAQVVAVSREAAFRYKKALDQAITNKIKELEKHPDPTVSIDLLKKLEVAVVFTGAQNDPPEYTPYNQGAYHKEAVERFKLKFEEEKNGKTGNVGIIVVQNMLLLGFDAPIEQVMYIDRKLVDHNLLQAVARVNRTAAGKSCGFVVDYIGIANHLKDALAKYVDRDQVDIERVLIKKDAELANLRHSHRAVIGFFTESKIYDIEKNIESAVDVLEDEEKRLVFLDKFKKFTKDMDAMLPDARALEFICDLKLFALISHLTRTRYRDDKFSTEGLSQKLRLLVDEYLISKGVDVKIPPVPIIDEKFTPQAKDPKARTREIVTGIREHISQHQELDPVFYADISRELEAILEEYRENWEKQLELFQPLIDRMRQGRKQSVAGLDPKYEMPFYDILRTELFLNQDIDENKKQIIADKTKDAIEAIKRECRLVGFWDSPVMQRRLRQYLLLNVLSDLRGIPQVVEKKNRLVFRWLELASSIHQKLQE